MISLRKIAMAISLAAILTGTSSCGSPADVPGSSVSLGPVGAAETDLGPLPISPMDGSFVVDMENPDATVGLVDYVFVAQVLSYDGVKYPDLTTMPRDDGSFEQVGTPYSEYTIEVIDNLKGKLKKNQPLPIVKEGGIALNEKSVYLFEDDQLPQPGAFYIFLGFAQSDSSMLGGGSILISGPNSSVPLDANSKSQIVSSREYKDYVKAVKNQILFERERAKSQYEEQ